MLQCWELDPGKRPPFSELVKSLSVSLEFMADYVPLCQQSSESEGHESVKVTVIPHCDGHSNELMN